MIRIQAGFYQPIKDGKKKYGKVVGFAIVVPRRTGVSGFKIITGDIKKYSDLDDFFFSIARRYRMPARQIARIPMMAELQISPEGIKHMLVYRGIRNWRSFREQVRTKLTDERVIWHDKEA